MSGEARNAPGAHDTAVLVVSRFDRPLIVLLVVAAIALPLVLLWHLRTTNERLAHERARELSQTIQMLRLYYHTNVFATIRASGAPVVFSEHFRSIEHALPIPATYAFDVGAIVSGNVADEVRADLAASPMGQAVLMQMDGEAHARGGAIGSEREQYSYSFVSDYPWPHRADRVMSDFEVEALAAFRADSSLRSYTRSEGTLVGSVTHLHATPVVMMPPCLGCHNAGVDSPKRDWQVGDVRGVEVVGVLDYDGATTNGAALMAPYFGVIVLSAFIAVGRSRRSNRRLAVFARDLDLARRDAAEKATRLEAQAQLLEEQVDQLGLLAAVAESASFGITIADARDASAPIVYANEAFYAMFGSGPADVLGVTCRILRGGVLEAASLQRMRDAVFAGQRHTVEILDRKPNGSSFWNRMTMFPVPDASGRPRFYVSFQMDITEERDAKEERDRMLMEIQEAQRFESLGVLVAGVAHEINNPLGIAVTAASHQYQVVRELQGALAREGVPEASPLHDLMEEQAESLALVAANLERAASLVRSFKDVAADRTDDHRREVDLHEFLGSLVSTMSPMLQRARCDVRLNVASGLRVDVPTGSFGQLITNLVVNATVHAFDGVERPEIRIVATSSDTAVRVEVRDNGNGLRADVMPRLFTPFHTTRRGEGGTGLGLYLARRIARADLSGDLSAANSTEGGAVFTLTFPIKRGSA